jgi:hypothetical protein
LFANAGGDDEPLTIDHQQQTEDRENQKIRHMQQLTGERKDRALPEQPIWLESETENRETPVLQAACAMVCA